MRNVVRNFRVKHIDGTNKQLLIYFTNEKFRVLMAVDMRIVVFKSVKPSGTVSGYSCWRKMHRLHLQGETFDSHESSLYCTKACTHIKCVELFIFADRMCYSME
jgi:hypothetical protein